MKIFIIVVALLMFDKAIAQTTTIEQHNGITYGRSSDGKRWQTEIHNGITYGRTNDGYRWSEEKHNGVTYVYPQN